MLGASLRVTEPELSEVALPSSQLSLPLSPALQLNLPEHWRPTGRGLYRGLERSPSGADAEHVAARVRNATQKPKMPTPYIKVQRQETWPRAKPLQPGTCFSPSLVIGLVILGKLSISLSLDFSDGADAD